MKSDFFTRISIILAFIGFGAFMVLGSLAILFYAPGWSILDDSFSIAGSIIPGNDTSVVLMMLGLGISGALMIPVAFAFMKSAAGNLKEKKQYFAFIGCILQVVGRVFMILVGLFPKIPWDEVHDSIAIVWFVGEVSGMVLIGIEMLRGKRDIAWGIVALVLVALGGLLWIPYGDWYDGAAIPEIASVAAIYGFAIAMWIRALGSADGILLGNAR